MAPQSRPTIYSLQDATINGKASWLLEYRRGIESGRIVAGRELRDILNMLVEQLDDPQFIYHTGDASFRVDFIERFCKHTKSPFHGKPFLLELWQKAFIEATYSFKWANTALRRFKKIILLVARKNGKSTLCAALAMAEFFCGNPGADIVCSSNDDQQASIIYDEINNMREMFDPKNKRSKKNQRGIFHHKTKSKIFKISDKTQNKEGRNIDFAILDESHEMKTNVIGESIEQSQSTKMEPLFFNITTEGFTNGGYLDDELRYARKVIQGEQEDYTILPWLYSMDSEMEIYQSPESWLKANPSLHAVKQGKYIEDKITKARADKGARIFMLAKDFNIKQNNAAAWLMEDEIVNPETYHMEELRGCIAIGGVDLSETTDLTASKVRIFKPGDNKVYVLSRYFIPKGKIERNEDDRDYQEWARQGLIDVTDGYENDFSLITNWFVSLVRDFGLRIAFIGYDRRSAAYWVKEMRECGFHMEAVNMDKYTLSPAMKLLEIDLRAKHVNYNHNPIDVWCLQNTAISVDTLGFQMPVKVNDQRNRRIDGTLALIILYAVYIQHRSEILNAAA